MHPNPKVTFRQKMKEKAIALLSGKPADISRPESPKSTSTQEACILFRKLPLEIRLQIYADTVGSQGRPLHILASDYRKIRRLAHWECHEVDQDVPMWQHDCLFHLENKKIVYRQLYVRSNSNLLPLLLTCRLIYAEALKSLYSENIFEFQSSKTLLAFRSGIPQPQWKSLRTVHLWTVFTGPLVSGHDYNFPPERFPRWLDACRALQEIHTLQSLHVDLIFQPDRYANQEYNQQDVLLEVLESLNCIKAARFCVKTNVGVPESVITQLLPLHYTISAEKLPWSKEPDDYFF
ncbi:hypothetical protein P154DRAFT_615234 [Amniculicola lignicola CBS 123094]|uniref:DUF7730 domain-containing protein n=1 Tax=Amniculicola lignicola CBS 123094 TaxID=1392246 RepID=A0A6A5WXE4_9PLEO|nr:hypothetical protein P154DRAFT_615234 [Amniculicola lignicola CBS 123094]